MSPLVGYYYRAWLDGPKLFENPDDERRFYRFVKACMKFCKNPKPTGRWFQHYVQKDLNKKFGDSEIASQYVRRAVSLFDHLRDYHLTGVPYSSISEIKRHIPDPRLG
jgi:hypothetical protein